jgi:hypothetical protein
MMAVGYHRRKSWFTSREGHVVMTTTGGRENSSDIPGHQVFWFRRDSRTGGTVHVLPPEEPVERAPEEPSDERRD